MAEATLIVTIHKTEKRVLWAETDNEFVDFLFCLFSIPMGQVFNFLKDNKSFGCLTHIYQSAHVMGNESVVCNKDDILKPKVRLSSIPRLWKLESNSVVVPTITINSFSTLDLHTCNCYANSCSSYKNTTCSRCKGTMDTPVKHYVLSSNPPSVDVAKNGFVKGGGAKYIVTDNLSVTSKSSFSFLNYFKTANLDPSKLEEKIVKVNVDKCKELVKLALTSNHMVLTSLFKDELGF